ncbi:MAG TPA: septum formation initiator family protein [Actinomycetes bacterium]
MTARQSASRRARRRGAGGERSGLTSRGILLFLVLFVLAATAVYPLRQYIAQQERIERLQAKQAALQAANQRLEQEQARLRDPAYVEQLAKQDFHMARPGEQTWLLTGTPPADRAAKPAAEPAPHQPWYQRAWHWLTDRSR